MSSKRPAITAKKLNDYVETNKAMVQTKKCVDHIDNDKQKNDLLNLRFATCKENTQNRTIRSLHTSGVKDESWLL